MNGLGVQDDSFTGDKVDYAVPFDWYILLRDHLDRLLGDEPTKESCCCRKFGSWCTSTLKNGISPAAVMRFKNGEMGSHFPDHGFDLLG
jgi:hypothetical protein